MVTKKCIVKTACGAVSGTTRKGVTVFKGIPYAKPPVGELRWAPPQECDPWDGVRECNQYGHAATQSLSVLVNTQPDEDCLYLNVWTPENAQGRKLPVYFWIHGGGYFNGCGTSEYYDGSAFARKDVIVVTINYRLGTLGFLALETLMKKYGTTGNWGTLDQIAALKWVQKNIEAFGGDPQRVTLAGESAGSFSVSSIIMSPLAKGLFSRAVMESGNFLSNKVAVPHTKATLEGSIANSRDFAALFGADDSEEGLEKLRGVDAMKLWETGFFSSDASIESPMAFWSTQDGVVIPRDPLKELRAGNYNHVQCLLGYNYGEGAVFIGENSTEEGAEKYPALIFGDKAGMIENYYKDKNLAPLPKLVDIVTYAYFKAGMTEFAKELCRQGQDVYVYQYDYTPDGNYPMKQLGPHHTVELLYTFASIRASGLTEGPGDKIVEAQVNTLWSNFVTNGDPNKGRPLADKTVWEKYNPDDPQIYYIDKKCEFKPTWDQKTIDLFSKALEY